jgi:hypothetical protein
MAQVAFDWLGGQEQMSPSSDLHFHLNRPLFWIDVVMKGALLTQIARSRV